MKITLYKNCIFSRSYSEVCDCRIKDTNGKTALDRYLATLTKEVFEIDTVYSTNAGTLNLPIQFPNSTDSLYDFNYLKIEYESLTRYCFIDNIQFMNYVAVVSYSEDVWHSYSGSMTMRKGFLQNATFTNYGDLYLQDFIIPAVHDSLKPIIIKQFEPISGYYIIAQAQIADLGKAGEETSRICYTVAIKRENIFAISWWEAQTTAMLMVTQQATKQNNKTCEFGNITIIPNYMFADNLMGETQVWSFTTDNVTYTAYRVAEQSTIKEVYSKVLDYNKNRKNIGTYGTDYEYRTSFWKPNSVSGNKVSLGVFVGYTDFKLILSYQGQVIDITSAFVFDVPFTSITGAEAQQAKIARTMETINGAAQIVGGAVDIGASIASFGADTALAKTTQYMATHTAKGNARRRYTSKDVVRLARGQAQEEQAGIDAVSGVSGGITSIVKGITGIIEANAQAYQSNTGTFVIGNNTLNCRFGLVEKIYDDTKEDYVDEVVKNIGYNVNAFVDDKIFTESGADAISGYASANTVKFNWVNMYGNFPQNVCETLKDILTSGTKIWYDERYI